MVKYFGNDESSVPLLLESDLKYEINSAQIVTDAKTAKGQVEVFDSIILGFLQWTQKVRLRLQS